MANERDNGEDVNLEFMIMHQPLSAVLGYVVDRDDVRRIPAPLSERLEAEPVETPVSGERFAQSSSTMRAVGYVSENPVPVRKVSRDCSWTSGPTPCVFPANPSKKTA